MEESPGMITWNILDFFTDDELTLLTTKCKQCGWKCLSAKVCIVYFDLVLCDIRR